MWRCAKISALEGNALKYEFLHSQDDWAESTPALPVQKLSPLPGEKLKPAGRALIPVSERSLTNNFEHRSLHSTDHFCELSISANKALQPDETTFFIKSREKGRRNQSQHAKRSQILADPLCQHGTCVEPGQTNSAVVGLPARGREEEAWCAHGEKAPLNIAKHTSACVIMYVE